jgi:hypothetical protein
VVNDDTVELWGDASRQLAQADPRNRELTVSCGAALLHLRLAIQHFGYSTEIELMPDPQANLMLAKVRMAAPLRWRPDDSLFQAIRMRRTNRGDFEPRQVPPPVLERLQAAASFEGANLMILESERARNQAATLIEEADHVQAQNGAYRSELADWLRSNRSSRRDGVPGYALGLNTVSSYVAPWLIRVFEMDQADEDRRQIMESPELAVLWTAGDTPLDWLIAGQALGRVLLRACAEGLQVSFFTQVLEVEATRNELHQNLALPGHAQMVFRTGYGEPGNKPTPRRPADEVTR